MFGVVWITAYNNRLLFTMHIEWVQAPSSGTTSWNNWRYRMLDEIDSFISIIFGSINKNMEITYIMGGHSHD